MVHHTYQMFMVLLQKLHTHSHQVGILRLLVIGAVLSIVFLASEALAAASPYDFASVDPLDPSGGQVEIFYDAFGDPYIRGSDPGDGTVVLDADGNVALDASGNPVTPPQQQTAAERAAAATQVGDGGLLNALYGFVVVFFGKLVTFGAYILHIGVDSYVINFGSNFLNSGFGYVVDNTWATVRDFFNLTFIFGLIYIGFRMILFADDNQAKRTLGTLVGAALLVNFSLFITKFLVDISNSLATVIYAGFKSSTEGLPVNIGDAFISTIGLSSVLNITSQSITLGVDNVGVGLAITFMTMIFFLVAAFVFAAGGILLIIRFIVLNFLMVFSPIMFIGWVFPGMAKYSSQYMSMFLKNAFMAPAYIFCLYFSYRILVGMQYTITGNLANIVNPDNTAPMSEVGGALAYFAIAMVLLLASMKIAKDMGALGAGTAISLGNNLRGRAQRGLGAATVGVGGRIGRNSVGWGANKFTQSETGKRWASSNFAGKALYKASARVADSSFDVRQVGGVGKAMGIGEGVKGGYSTRLKESEKAEKKFLDDMGTQDASTNPAVMAAEAAKDGAEAALQSRRAELNAQTADERGQIRSLNEEYKTAPEDRKQAIALQISGLQSAINAKEKGAEDEIKLLEEAVKSAKTNLERTTAQTEYGHQLQYIQTLENWQKKKAKLQLAAGSIIGVGAGILSGGVIPLAAAAGVGASVGLTAFGSTSHTASDARALRKEYGSDGTKKKKSKAQKDRIGDIAAEVAKASGDKKSDDSKSETA